MSLTEFYFIRHANHALQHAVMFSRLIVVLTPVFTGILCATFYTPIDASQTLIYLAVWLLVIGSTGYFINKRYLKTANSVVSKSWKSEDVPATQVGETLSALCELPHRTRIWDASIGGLLTLSVLAFKGLHDQVLLETSASIFSCLVLLGIREITLHYLLVPPLNRLRDMRGAVRTITLAKPLLSYAIIAILLLISIVLGAISMAFEPNRLAFVILVTTGGFGILGLFLLMARKSHRDLVATVQQLLSGRFDLPTVDFAPNHFGELALGLYASVQSIKDKIVYLQRNGIEMYSTTHRISDLSAEQNQSLVRQSSAVSETSTTLEELVNSSTRISDLASRVVGYAEDTERHSEKGLQFMQKTALAIRHLDAQNRDSLKTIASLNDQMQEISRILGLINNIADETNLIALNAAIEASSAGEFGHRFKVVANEVRDLSDNVGRSIKEIQTMSRKIQDVMNDLIKSANHISVSMQASVDQSQRTYDFLKEILDWARKSSEAAKQIYVAINQQRLANKQISLSFTDISSDIQTLASTSQQYASTIDVLKKFSANMEAVIQFFIKRSPESRLNEEKA